MYQSKFHVEKKLAQAQLVLNEMQKFRGKVFVNNCKDMATGAYPLQTKVGHFLSCARSALQYMHKECKERGLISDYDRIITTYPLIGIFKKPRDIDIHECAIGVQTVISLVSPIHLESNSQRDESRNQEANPEDAKVRQCLLTPIAGKTNHYEVVAHDGEEDFYILFDQYLMDIHQVLKNLEALGAVT